MKPLLRYLTGVLLDEAIREQLEPGGAAGGNFALDLFDLGRQKLVSRVGLEPTTYGLKVRCSTS